uniref:BTB domain-containing protein n=1 Tax=Propithecus coquereli TaxID=379532 RepID=A0A2K6GZU9_PROCO
MQSQEDALRSHSLGSPTVLAFFTGPEELKDTAHSAALLAQLKSFYGAQLLCDVTIEVVMPGSGPGTGHLFSCNCNMLAAACPYFKSMFTGGMYESQQASVTMNDVDGDRASLSEANVQHLYAASNVLQLEYVREACASFLARRLDLANYTAILKFADAFDHHKLRSQAQPYIAHNFKHLSQMDSIREETLADLTLAQLLAVPRLDSLNIESKQTVCHVAVQWLETAPKERDPSATEVFKCVHWMHFTENDQDYLQGLLTKPIVKQYCLDIIEGVLEMRYGDMYKSLVPVPKSSSSCVVCAAENPPQRLDMCAKKMVIFFGHPRDPFLCCDPYSGDIYKNSWQQLADCLLCREGMDMAYLNGYIYILGGQDPITKVKLKKGECYSVQRNQWALVAPLSHSFISFNLMVIQNYLYVLNSRRMLCYDPSHNMWLKCVSLKPRYFEEACVFNDEIYCICKIPVMKVYNPVRGEWKQINNIPLVSDINNCQIINYGQKLLIITLHTQRWNKNQVTVYEYDASGNVTLSFFCLSAHVYPSCLEPGKSFLTEEDDIWSGLDCESESITSFSDDDFWTKIQNAQDHRVSCN